MEFKGNTCEWGNCIEFENLKECPECGCFFCEKHLIMHLKEHYPNLSEDGKRVLVRVIGLN